MSCQSQRNDINNMPIQNFEPNRYVGKWYEIARFNHRFERGLVGVTATYTLLENGKIEVFNAGYKNSLTGEFTTAKAKAQWAESSSIGWLKVYFVPLFGANYYVMEIGEQYEWALVGSSSDKYLWILSRTPQLDDTIYQSIVDLATARGYKTDNLIKVEQAK